MMSLLAASYAALIAMTLWVAYREGNSVHCTVAGLACLLAGFTGFSLLPTGFGLQVSYALGLLLFVVQYLRRRRLKLPTPVFAVWLAVVLCSSVMSYAASGPIDGMRPWIKSGTRAIATLTYSTLFIAIYNHVRVSPRRLELASYYLRAGAALAAVIGLMQPVLCSYGLYDVADLFWNNPSYGGVVAKLSGLAPVHVAQSRLGLIRPWGPGLEPSYFASFLAVGVLTQLGFTLQSRLTLRQTAFYVLTLSAIILAQARSALIGLSIGVFGLLLTQLRTRRLFRRMLVIAGVVWIGVAITASFIQLSGYSARTVLAERFGFIPGLGDAPEDESASARLAALRIALDMFSDYPLLGVGMGNYGFHVYDYLRTEYHYTEFSAGMWHVPFGWPATALSETGLLGAASLLALLISIGSTWRAVNVSQWQKYCGLWWSFICLSIIGLGASQMETPYWWICLGLLCSVEALQRSSAVKKRGTLNGNGAWASGHLNHSRQLSLRTPLAAVSNDNSGV